ncbi:MAG: anaerobic sulfite reductase subunit AsrB [Lachnospirales bacterium]
MTNNEYIPFKSEIKEIIKHTEIEFTFRMAFEGNVKPGQFFEVSLPKFGEAPISVSGIGEGTVDLTIRKVGHVTREIFESGEGQTLFMRGPYGNGFDVNIYKGKELIIVAGGTGVSPVRGVIDYFARNIDQVKSLTVIAGFKSTKDVLFKDDFEYWYSTGAKIIKTIDKEEEGYTGPVGLVTNYIPDLTIVSMNNVEAIVVGPPIMMKFATKALLDRGLPEKKIWVSQERKMCCGVGKCGHCKINDKYVCLNGPVFNYVDNKSLID